MRVINPSKAIFGNVTVSLPITASIVIFVSAPNGGLFNSGVLSAIPLASNAGFMVTGAGASPTVGSGGQGVIVITNSTTAQNCVIFYSGELQ